MSWRSLSLQCSTGVNERYLSVKLNLSFWPIYAFFFPAKFLSVLELLLGDRAAAERTQAADITYANLGSQGINAQLVRITTASLEQWVLSGCPQLMVQLGGSALVAWTTCSAWCFQAPRASTAPEGALRGLGLHGNKAEQWDAALPLLEVHTRALCTVFCAAQGGAGRDLIQLELKRPDGEFPHGWQAKGLPTELSHFSWKLRAGEAWCAALW